ncbi:YidH family protein [Nocardioides sp. SYSU DS0651]|uniref:YidH family protein n=1 Tax=Nocardioides sp. SYSU DS0651 TaxID=3415955 RepID=UPI003F4B76E0
MSDGTDPRFSLANERTFLAWIRTALGLLAAAAALVAIDLPWPDGAVRVLAAVLAATGGVSAFLAWHRWRAVESAIAEGRPAPTPRAHAALAMAVALVAVAVVVLTVVSA